MAEEIPPGYVLAPSAGPPPATPQATPSGQIPPGYTLVPLGSQPDAPPQPYQGKILPFSTNASGNTYFDPHAGVLGAALDAFALPGDVWTGKQPTPYSGGPANDPALSARITNLATFFPSTGVAASAGLEPRYLGGPTADPPLSVAPRAGEMFPGVRGSEVAPTGAALADAANAGYAAARASPLTIPSSTVVTAAQNLQQTLRTDFGLVPKTAPNTFSILEDLATPGGGPVNYTSLDAVNRQLKGIRTNPTMGGSDVFAANQVIPGIDDLIGTISPEAAMANANLAAAKRADAITGELTQANTGILEKADTAARLRQAVKTFLQNPDNVRGFTKEETDSLDAFAKGNDVLTNVLTKVGKIPGSGIMAAGIGAYLGSTVFGGHGGEIGAMIAPMAGNYFTNWATQRTRNQLDAIAQTLRSRSPLGEQLQGTMRPNLSVTSQLPYRALPPSLLSSQPSAQPAAPAAPGQFPPLPTTGPIPAGLLGQWA